MHLKEVFFIFCSEHYKVGVLPIIARNVRPLLRVFQKYANLLTRSTCTLSTQYVTFLYVFHMFCKSAFLHCSK